MKTVLMIHEVREWMFDLPLEDYILTFDDGLYSQYYHFDRIKKLQTEKYFFISTNIICPENQEQSTHFPSCSEAHKHYFETHNAEHYMKWSQIQEISRTTNCYIGGHSHAHKRLEGMNLKALYDHLQNDTQLMMDEFAKQGIKINSFCYPYNKQYILYEEILKKHNLRLIFGDQRTAIEDLK